MTEVLHFAGLFLLTNIGGGAVVAAFLLGRNDHLRLPAWPLVLVGFGLGPFIISLLLYYALVLWPGLPTPVLATLPLLIFCVVAFVARGWKRLWEMFCGLPALFVRDRTLWWLALGSVLLLVVALVMLIFQPLVYHDALEYAMQGQVFLRDRAIVYQRHHYDALSGFYYVGLHGFSFPLLFTWEGFAGDLLNVEGDLWTRSITSWYTWLLVLFTWSLARRIHEAAALTTGFAMTAPLGFMLLLTIYHLDSYRLFFFGASVAAFVALLKAPSSSRAWLFGVLCGAQAFIHSIGAILGGALWFLVVLMLPVPWSQRLRWCGSAAVAILFMGGIHYLLDTFIGTGWIFQDIIWF